MAKLTLPRMQSGFLSVDMFNSAMADIEVFVDSLLSRDGLLPNQMEADIDLNGHSLLNLGPGSDLDSLVTVDQMQTYVEGQAAGIVVQRVEFQVATAAQTVFTLQDFEYAQGSNNLAVYKNGERIFTPADYTETSSSVVTLVAPAALNDDFAFVSNEFLGTVDLPPHQHTWDQITGKPDTATRNPTYAEVTDKPATFAPSSHVHNASTDITTGRLPDARRGVHVQASTPTASTVGELWFY